MALPTKPNLRVSMDFQDQDEELSHDYLKALLHRAEKRMKAAIESNGSGTDIFALGNHSSTEEVDSVAKLPKLRDGSLMASYISSTDGVARTSSSQGLGEDQKRLSNQPRCLKKPFLSTAEKTAKKKKITAGPDWYYMQKTDLTPELKRDLQLFNMRSVIDSKRHYKTDTSKTIVPDFCEVGTILEGPTEYFSSRVPNKQRRKTFVEEILDDKQLTAHFREKYDATQVLKASGKKGFYKNLKEKRHRGIHKR